MGDALMIFIYTWRWNEWCVMSRIDKTPTEYNDQYHNSHFSNHDKTIHIGRFFCSFYEQQTQYGNDGECGNIHDSVDTIFCVLKRRVTPFIGDGTESQNIYKQVI